MRVRSRSIRSSWAFALVLALPSVACQGEPEGPERGVATALARVPQSVDTAFASLVERISEPGGYFDTDNLISNESSYLHVVDDLEARGISGGAYIGVGPDQNFSYMAQVRPDVAFLIDIRRDNMLQHLFFKALFALAPTRVEYLALLVGAQAPGEPGDWVEADVEDLVEFFDESPRAAEVEARVVSSVRDAVVSFGVPLDQADLDKLAFIHGEFVRERLGLRFHSFGRPPQPYYPTLRQLLLEHDRAGRRRSYLGREDDYAFLRELQARNRVIPVVGDLAGDHALREIGEVLREMGEEVSAFYTSNVEFYLMGARTFDAFAETVSGLPIQQDGVFIRSYFHRFRSGHPETVPGYASTQLTQPLAEFVSDVGAGGYRSYTELVFAGERARR